MKKKTKKVGKNKKAMELKYLGWWILGIGVLVLMLIGYFLLRGKGEGALEFIQRLFRLRR